MRSKMKGFSFNKYLSKMSKKLMKKSWRELKKSFKEMGKVQYSKRSYDRELIKRGLKDHNKRLDLFRILDQLQKLSGDEFEDWVENLFKKMGFKTNLTRRSSDKGIDLYIEKSERKSIVQCKRHIGSIGSSTVRDFYGALVDSGADEGYIVTTGTFTLPAKSWAQGKPINLIDGAELINIIQILELEKEKTGIPKLESDKAKKEFYDNLIVIAKSRNREKVIWKKFYKKNKKIESIEDKIKSLKEWETKKLGKLSKKILDILPEAQDIIKKIREITYDQAGMISILQGNVNKISGLSIKLIAQEFVDNLIERKNFNFESLRLLEKDIKNYNLYYNNCILFLQGKFTIEELTKRNEKIKEEGESIRKRIKELSNNIIAIEKKWSKISAKMKRLS